ncbi:MAG: serine protease Do [Verrucomicrobiota bacterium]|jgi:hypothetical protein
MEKLPHYVNLMRLITVFLVGITLNVQAAVRQFATVVKPIKIAVLYGEVVLPPGMRLEVISLDTTTVRVIYMGSVRAIPIAAVTIERDLPAPIKEQQALAGTSLAPALGAAPVETSAGSSPSPTAAAMTSKRSQRGGRQSTSAASASATYAVRTDKGQGSAFLVRMDGNSYLITNYHVLSASLNAEFIRSDGTRLNLQSSSAIEVAADRDLVRIGVPTNADLVPADAPALNQEIDVYGNPGGQEVITNESGKLLGIGQTEIEVSAKFIPGNSGGPIVQAETGKVLGVATYLKRHSDMAAWITNKTRFEQARRFGVRLDPSIKWSQTSWSSFFADTVLTESLDSFLNDSVELTRVLATSPYRSPFSSRADWPYEIQRLKCRQVYAGIVAAYNGTCDEYASTLNKPIYGGELTQTNQFFAGRVRGHASNLGRCLQEASVDLSRLRHHFSAEYTDKQFHKLVNTIGEFGGLLEKHAPDIANKNMFKLSTSSQ